MQQSWKQMIILNSWMGYFTFQSQFYLLKRKIIVENLENTDKGRI